MSSLLRTSKFLKCFSYSGRNVILPRRTFQVVPVQTTSSHNFYYRDYASAAAQLDPGNNTVDKYIRRLDKDVRRNGRTTLRELQEVLDEIKLSNQATSTQSLMVIRCCGTLIPEETPEVKLKLVKDIWDTLEKQGVSMDVSHYNALLIVYLENEFEFSPTEFLTSLEKKGIEPNRVTFQRLIAAYCQQGNIDGATRILEFMKEKQMPISENIFNSLITGHSHANDMESAKGILSVMQQTGVEPSSETYTAFLCGHAKNGNMNGITQIFSLAESKDTAFQDRQLLEVVYNMAVNGHLQLIDIILPHLNRMSGYNQDAKNTILRLIAKGHDEAAMKVYKTMTPITAVEDEPLPKGTFLLRQMIKMNRSMDTITSICKELVASKDNERALYYAIESCYLNGKIEMALKLLSSVAQTEAVHQHYYWPAICHFGKKGDHEGILRTLKQMSVHMNQAIPNETLREYVVEHIGPNEKGIITLRQAGVTVASASSAVVAYHLNNMDLQAAAKIASKYRANYNLAVIRRGIIQSYKIKPDVDSLILLVRSILSNLNNLENSEVEETKEGPDPAGFLLLSIASTLRQDRSNHITQILKGYLEYGLGISNATAVAIQEALNGTELTPEISNLLSQLTSPDLSLVALERAVPSKSVAFNQDEKAILDTMNEIEAKNESTDSYKFQLISLYCKQQEYDKAAKIRQELTDKGIQLTSDYLSQLLNVCVLNETFSESDNLYKEIMNKTPIPKINEGTLVRLAGLYITADKFDEALNIFEKHKPENCDEKEFSYNSTCWKLLNSIAESGDVNKVEKLFNTMKNCNFIIPTNVLLGPLIKVHLVNGDLKKALEKFEECCTLYKSTPWKNEIACKLIQSEDATSLQKLTDLSSKVHGEVNSLYDLVLSFIECGRVRQARRILETPGLRTRHSRLSSACLRYQNEGRVNYLENLVEVTKDLPHIDRADIYYHLLGSYSVKNEVDKALGLWTQMQEEDVQPSDRFLIRLANLLVKHNRSVPFSVPSSTTTDRLNSIEKEAKETLLIKSFRRAVYNKDLDKALQIKQNILDAELQTSDRSNLITLIINNGRLGESIKLLTQWLEIGLRPNIKTLNLLINSVAKTGDVNSLDVIGNMLDEDLKKVTSFSNRYTHCMVEAGRAEEVFQKLESDLDAANTPEKLDSCNKTFPRGGILSVLASSPDFVPRFEKLALKYKEKGMMEPLNMLWINYMLHGDKENANKIWPSIKTLDRLMYQPILKKARAERDLVMAQDLLKHCNETNINASALGAVHSCILDIYVLLEKMDECSAYLDETLKTIPIENIYHPTLRKIKVALENNGKLFKYTIPPRRTRGLIDSSSSSDSDSDEEVRRKA